MQLCIKIKKINFKTKELVEIYDSLKEACKNNKVSAFNLKLSYDDLRFLQKENVCRPVSLDKRILLAKKYLTIKIILQYIFTKLLSAHLPDKFYS